MTRLACKATRPTVDYWNHHTAYHAELLSAVLPSGGDALDIGCGGGLLVERLATKATSVIGLDPDSRAIDQSGTRRQLFSRQGMQILGTARGNHRGPTLHAIKHTHRHLSAGSASLTGLCALATGFSCPQATAPVYLSSKKSSSVQLGS